MAATASLVRQATPADEKAAVATLGAAFADYAWTRHTVAADNHEERVRRLQAVFLGRLGLPFGRVWVTDRCEAVAVWATSETMQRAESTFAELEPLLAELAGDRFAMWVEAEATLMPHRPQEPVWLLNTVAVAPSCQGRGLGSAVLQPGLAAADAAGLPAYLETSSARNVPFYERLGFVVETEVDLPGGGPRTWCMMRRR